MGFLFILIISVSAFLLLFPIAFKLLCTYILGFSKAEIKIKNPFTFVGILLQLKDPLWAIDSIIIYLPEIKLRFDRRNVKFCVLLSRPRIMLMRAYNQLLPLKIVDGIKQSNLFYNIITIIKSLKQKQGQTQKLDPGSLPEPKAKQKKQQSRFRLAIKAVSHFISLIVIQFVEVKILNGDIAIVSSMPKNSLKLNSVNVRSTVSMLECFAEYLLYITQLSVSAGLHDDHQINIVISCPILKLYTAQHMEQVLVKSEDLQIDVRVPFTFSLQKSFSKIRVFITAPKINSYSTPIDFENLSKFINQMLLNCDLFTNTPEKSSQSAQSPKNQQNEKQISAKKFVLYIQLAQIKLTNISEQGQDTPQALKYLSNLIYGLLKFQKIRLNEDGFTVDEVSLSVKKYNTDDQFQQLSTCREVLKINNLLITKEANITKISHDDVKFSCQREELALLSKIFILINSRIIIDQYDQQVYLPYFDVVKQYTEGKISLNQAFEQIVSRKFQNIEQLSHMMNSTQISENRLSYQSLLIYSPKIVELELNISELIHKITLHSSEYRQSRTLAGEITHQLSFKRIMMDYKGIKQFQVADFKLFYKQIETMNELEMQVGDIQMIQNFNTLKDYLIGFTIFKLLLQFDNEQLQKQKDQSTKKKGKIGKKSLNFGRIVINYATQLLTLRKISIIKQTNPDGKLSSSYFSLSKCDLSVERLYQPNKLLRYPLNHSHNLLSVSSVTIKQFLTTIGSTSINSPKQKYMINIKNPIFMLPQIDIEDRLLNYVKTFNKLQPSIEVFMNNTTQQKLRARRRKYKVFMIETDVFIIKVTNLLIGIEDTVFDRSMLNKMRFFRQYLERKPKYNESQYMNYLKQTAMKLNLFQIQIQSISINITPLEIAGLTQKSVKLWVNQLRQKYKQNPRMTELINEKQKQQQNDQTRLIRVNNFDLSVQFTGLRAKIRDYPFDIIHISKVKNRFQYVKTKNMYEQTFHYLLSSIIVQQVSVNIGLSLLSGFKDIFKKLNKYSKAMDQYKNTDQFLNSLKSKTSLQLTSYKPFWHIMHKSAYWFINIEKKSQIKILILTGITPYSKQSLSLKLGSISLLSHPVITQLSIQFLQLSGNNAKKLTIFQFGRERIGLKTIYNEPDLNLNFTVEIESRSSQKDYNNLKNNVVRVSEQIALQLWKIKQLRTDWLLIYGLVEPSSKKQENVLKRQQQFNYIQLLKLTMDRQLKNKDRELSIFSVLKQIKFSAYIDKFSLQLADQDNQVDVIINNFRFQSKVQAEDQKWIPIYFTNSVSNIIGRLKIFKRKIISLYQSNHQFLKAFLSINEKQINERREERQTFRQIFLVCRQFNLKIGKFAQIRKQIHYIQKKFEIASLKIQLTTQLKRMLDSLIASIFETNIKKVQKLTKPKYFQMNSVQKIREMVVLVIRANRKMKKPIKKLKVYAVVKCFQLSFKTAKRLLLLTNQNPAVIRYETKFINQDIYHVDPKICLGFDFSNVQLWVSTSPNHLWILSKNYSPKTLGQSQRVLKCSRINFELEKHQNQIIPPYYQVIVQQKRIERFTNLYLKINEGLIELTRQNIQVLKQISQILISIVSSKEQKKKQLFAQKQKYQQMITNGRQAIKSKLTWAYSDFIKKPAPALLSKIMIVLQKTNFLLYSGKDPEFQKRKQQASLSLIQLSNQSRVITDKYPLINLITSNVQVNVQVCKQLNFMKQFKISNLTILNCLEPEDSLYRLLLEMNHENQVAISVKVQDSLLPASSPQILWNFYKSLYVRIFPIKIKLTQQLYQQIYYFFFGMKPQSDDQKQEQLRNIIPDYYLQLIIDQFKVQVWFRTPSRLKRLEGVSIGLEKFQINDVFFDRKQIFDRWVRFLLKQLASQIFSVLGQKLFG